MTFAFANCFKFLKQAPNKLNIGLVLFEIVTSVLSWILLEIYQALLFQPFLLIKTERATNNSKMFTCQITHFRLCRCPRAVEDIQMPHCPSVSWVQIDQTYMRAHGEAPTSQAVHKDSSHWVCVWLLMFCWTFSLHERALVLWETSSKVFGFWSRKFVPSIGKPPTMLGLWHGG